MESRSIQDVLNRNGFPCGQVDGVIGPATRAAVVRFQSAHAFGRLEIDGVPGPATQQALGQLPYLSPHFQASELACHHCHLTYVNRELLFALELLRAKVGPLGIEDAYRCPAHNAAIKGSAQDSMHVLGGAADLTNMPALSTVLDLKAFSGVGNRGTRASHVDVRHVMGAANHTPDATPTRPARWSY